MVLVDSSVWIAYFKGNESALPLNALIDSNNLCINDLILAELLPSIHQKKESDLKELLLTVERTDLQIDWHQIIAMQTLNLRKGINQVGISDLIIAQHAIQNNFELYALDKYFALMRELHALRLYQSTR